MKTILLYANEDSGFESRYQAALDLVRAFDAHLGLLQVTPYDAFIMGDPFGGIYALPTVLAEVRKNEDEHRVRVEGRLRAEGVAWDWDRWDGSPAQVLISRARLVDAVVVSLAPADDSYDGPLSLAADVSLHARAPVLAVPPAGRSIDLFGPAIVAWDGSAEAAHALRLALPILARATVVHIVTVAEDESECPSADAATYLSRHDVASELHEWPRDGRTTSAALLDAASVLEASYVVMGVYGHSRLREAVLGGATREMLRASPLPLLLAH